MRFRRFGGDSFSGDHVSGDGQGSDQAPAPVSGAFNPASEESSGPYIPSLEDFAPSPPKPSSPLTLSPDPKAARPALLFFVLFWVVSLHDWRGLEPNLTVSGEAVFKDGEWWRLLTALFDHQDLGHLLSNTPLFLIFGWYLRAYFGPLAFPLGALVVGMLSNLATVFIYPPGAELLGASGMLYGMVALWLVFYVRYEPTYGFGERVLRAVGVSVLLLFPTTFEKTTSYSAHATGFVLGLIAGALLAPVVRRWVPRPSPPAPPSYEKPPVPIEEMLDHYDFH